MICSIFLAAAVYTDVRKKIIPNTLTFPVIICGFLFHIICAGWDSGAFFALKGMAIGGALMMIPFLLGGTGGGDVKMLTALGTWMGCYKILEIFFYGSITGAVMAVILMFVKKYRLDMMSVWHDIVCFSLTLKRVTPAKKMNGFPYSIPIAIGFVIYIFSA